MNIKDKIRKICTYHTKGTTSGYLLDEDRFAKIFALLDAHQQINQPIGSTCDDTKFPINKPPMTNKEQETIKIKTLKDIIDKVPTETLEYFLEDLRDWIILHKALEEAKKNEKVNNIMSIKTSEIMKWIDDSDTGKHNNEIIIKLNEK